MKILVVASVLDPSLPFGCTPAWWQLLKGLHEAGADMVATPYFGRSIESLWWRAYPNPCETLGNAFATSRNLLRWLAPSKLRQRRAKSGPGWQHRLIHALVRPRWETHLERIIASEGPFDAILVLNVPLNHFTGLPRKIRDRCGVPIYYFDGDLPASLPSFGGFASGFSIYEGADLTEYDGFFSNSTGALPAVRDRGAKNAHALWWGADPLLFRPDSLTSDGPRDIDLFFYGLGIEYRRDWLTKMIAQPSRQLPHLRFVVAGEHLDMDLGNVQRIGRIPPSKLGSYVRRAKVHLNVARAAHAGTYASSTTRIFELAAMGCAIVSNPMVGIEEWFSPPSEIAVASSAEDAAAIYQSLCADPARQRSMGEAARRRVVASHTYAHRAQQMLKVLGGARS